MLRPTSGQVIYRGHDWRRGDLNETGALIESPPLYENLTARENLHVRTTLRHRTSQPSTARRAGE